jgi:hypothetical protein
MKVYIRALVDISVLTQYSYCTSKLLRFRFHTIILHSGMANNPRVHTPLFLLSRRDLNNAFAHDYLIGLPYLNLLQHIFIFFFFVL